ncbi:polysaccharide biosynthesis protein [Lentibacillus saliphilus]|uniref:polysaccharide biosynthesis protein n=1 Tax=Lentibacillus saliphilus TaxID=2737028 RepID=UPI001C30CE38|nr:nucleoside-diphosphate sugar epimerase/dehydratase [Lentibacillus saliphilus]
MTYRKRLFMLTALDSFIVLCAIFAASWIVYPSMPVGFATPVLIITSVALLVFHHIFALIYKLYNKVWAYASVGELLAIVKAVSLTVLSAGVVQFLVNDFSIYRRALIVTWLLHIIFIGGSRFVWRVFRDRYIVSSQDKKRTLIVGAGSAGTMIVRQLKNTHDNELLPVAFVDDDTGKQWMEIYGVPVLGRIKDIQTVVENHNIDLVVIAIPSLQNGELSEVVAKCNATKATVQMIPKIEDLMTGRVSVNNLKNVEVEDLLGRRPVELDINAISEYVTGQTVMVTGAGGSIGSELCRQLMRFTPGKIVLVGHGEFSIYTIDMELKQQYGHTETDIVPVIADVQDRDRMFEVIHTHQPTIIYHAAAHKHVPLMEYNPHEAVKNNVIGTKNVAEAADANGVNTFVLVSTDKAVNPTNVMGATKRIAEMVIQDLSKRSQTKYVAVRFGNVLGSRGSVIPLFKKQIERGGPVTVTDPEMTRYFMTIPEASRLVIQAGTLARGGEIFVLDMGEPVKIVDLARNLIRLSGYSEEDIEIHFTGKRPGEKMFEELLNENEVHPDAVYEKIYVGRTVEVELHIIEEMLENMLHISNEMLKDTLLGMVFMEQKQLTGSGR